MLENSERPEAGPTSANGNFHSLFHYCEVPLILQVVVVFDVVPVPMELFQVTLAGPVSAEPVPLTA